MRFLAMRIGSRLRRYDAIAAALTVALALTFGVRPGLAQEPAATAQSNAAQPGAQAPAGKPAKPPKPYGGGTPLDVILSTKLWVDPPEQKEFVKETRQPDSALHYQPTVGSDPKRPPLLNKNQLDSLQQELEQSGAGNEQAAGVKQKNFAGVEPPHPVLKKPHKEKPKRLSAEGPTQLHQP